MAWDKEGMTSMCAGKSLAFTQDPKKFRNHPRVRREESIQLQSSPPLPESPPRARGRVCLHGGPVVPYGITPACAGKSQQPDSCDDDTRNHPRMRGEECGGQRSAVRAVGITPACAGKSGRGLRPVRAGWNHPRMRGEECYVLRRSQPCMESPPRARGRVAGELEGAESAGIIPACAGKRGRWRPAVCPAKSHPRVRGEESSQSFLKSPVRESPPRARGRAQGAARRLL